MIFGHFYLWKSGHPVKCINLTIVSPPIYHFFSKCEIDASVLAWKSHYLVHKMVILYCKIIHNAAINQMESREPVNHFVLTNDPFFTLFFSAKMVLMINGVPLEESPRDIATFISQYPHFKESASRLCSIKPENIGPHGLVYVFAREFAVTHPHDNKISVMGTDDITTSHIVVIRHSGN